jgi:pyruvate,orthophosphate dikinase
MIETEIAEVFPDETVDVPVGTMIELPRAALLAGEIAGVADFFSFGTNDLTQTTYGLSRDDADRSFLPFFLEQGIYPSNPFQTMDEYGVGRLVEMGTAAGKEANPSLEVGVCGEHGGDPASIALCHRMGLDYVSASPPRIPVARLAAAQAALGGGDSAGSV